jgi:ethanolamine utilization protein EutN
MTVQLGRICGTVVATLKHAALRNRKVLLVQPVTPDGAPRGRVTAALDLVDAGPGDWVVYLDEGSGASQLLENPRGPVRTVVVGVVDEVAMEPQEGADPSGAIQDGTRG